MIVQNVIPQTPLLASSTHVFLLINKIYTMENKHLLGGSAPICLGLKSDDSYVRYLGDLVSTFWGIWVRQTRKIVVLVSIGKQAKKKKKKQRQKTHKKQTFIWLGDLVRRGVAIKFQSKHLINGFCERRVPAQVFIWPMFGYCSISMREDIINSNLFIRMWPRKMIF